MTLAERRSQVKRERHELSPMRDYMKSYGKKPKGNPYDRSDKKRAERGPAAEPQAPLQLSCPEFRRVR